MWLAASVTPHGLPYQVMIVTLSFSLLFRSLSFFFFWRSDRSFGDDRASLPPMIGGKNLRVALIVVVEMIHGKFSTEMHATLTEDPTCTYDAHTYVFNLTT